MVVERSYVFFLFPGAHFFKKKLTQIKVVLGSRRGAAFVVVSVFILLTYP